MPKTSQRFAGPLFEEEILLDDRTGLPSPTLPGTIRRQDGVVYIVDSLGAYDPRSGGGISDAEHKTRRHLVHFGVNGPAEGFVSGAYKETVGGLFPTSVIWYVDNTKVDKIVEKTIERSAGPATMVAPTPIVWKIYDVDGSTVLATVTDNITWSGIIETDRTRTIA